MRFMHHGVEWRSECVSSHIRAAKCVHPRCIDNFINALTLAEDTKGKISSCKFAKERVLYYSEDHSNAVSVMWGLSRG